MKCKRIKATTVINGKKQAVVRQDKIKHDRVVYSLRELVREHFEELKKLGLVRETEVVCAASYVPLAVYACMGINVQDGECILHIYAWNDDGALAQGELKCILVNILYDKDIFGHQDKEGIHFCFTYLCMYLYIYIHAYI